MESNSIGTGFILVHRKLLHSSFYQRSHYVHLWLHLLLKANHKGTKIIWNNTEIILEPGQFITGRKKLSIETGINENTIQFILSFFEKNNMIQQRNNRQNRIVSIVSWREFQNLNNEISTKYQRLNNEISTAQQRNNTDNNENNENNDNNDNNETIKAREGEKKLNFNFVAESIKNDFLEFILTKKKKPKTQNEIEAIYQHLQQLSNNNLPGAREILKQSIRNQWQDLYPLNDSQNPKTNKHGKQTSNTGKLNNLRAAASAVIQSANNTGNSE